MFTRRWLARSGAQCSPADPSSGRCLARSGRKLRQPVRRVQITTGATGATASPNVGRGIVGPIRLIVAFAGLSPGRHPILGAAWA
ncbi:hypothetical protein FrEUN1fDRAFT_3316 [Parafrankia sp. EUN1f]|nr:hypothetical protein FrEUN1fDRAFT_3316 [Parafrankia sp. EUN1f]